MESQKILNWIVVSISWISFTLRFFMNAILICYCYSQIFEVCHIFEGFMSYYETIVLYYFVFTRHKHNPSFLCVYFQTNLPTNL